MNDVENFMSESKENDANLKQRHDPDAENDRHSEQNDANGGNDAATEQADQAQAERTENDEQNIGRDTAAEDGELPGEDLEAQLAQAQEDVAKYYEELLRARAEVENIRRRAQEDVSKARKFGIESFAESLVPVIDSLEAALAQPDQDAQAWQSGVEATLRQLMSAFERNALAAVAPKVGDRFDPHLHQAISSIPAEQPEGTVVQLLQKGYTIAERVLRPALVVVSSGQAK